MDDYMENSKSTTINPFKSIFHLGKNRNGSNRFFAILCDFLRFFAIYFSEIKSDTGKRLKRTVEIYSLQWLTF